MRDVGEGDERRRRTEGRRAAGLLPHFILGHSWRRRFLSSSLAVSLSRPEVGGDWKGVGVAGRWRGGVGVECTVSFSSQLDHCCKIVKCLCGYFR